MAASNMGISDKIARIKIFSATNVGNLGISSLNVPTLKSLYLNMTIHHVESIGSAEVEMEVEVVVDLVETTNLLDTNSNNIMETEDLTVVLKDPNHVDHSQEEIKEVEVETKVMEVVVNGLGDVEVVEVVDNKVYLL